MQQPLKMPLPSNHSPKGFPSPTEIEGFGDPIRLYRLWSRETGRWSSESTFYCDLGQKLLDCAEPLLAFDVLHHALMSGARDARTRQLCAMALLRSGSIVLALDMLEALSKSGNSDEETMGLLARAHKALAFSAASPAARNDHMTMAFDLYRRAFELTGGYWTGINASTLALVLKNAAVAEQLASKVEEQCQAMLLCSGADQAPLFWPLATIAEASLILGKLDRAVGYYSRSVKLGSRRYGDIASMRRNAQLILDHKKLSFPIDEALPLPRVFCFTGHMVDLPGISKPRLPGEDLDIISQRVRLALRGEGAICYAAAACGSDIIFLDANQANGGDNHIVLPFPTEQFIEHSVRVGGEYWVERFERLIVLAKNVYVLGSESSISNEFSYRYASQMALGFARLKAREIDAELHALSVWDGLPSPAGGGTGDAVQDWRASGVNVEVITPPSAASMLAAPASRSKRPSTDREAAFTPEIRAMLFGDVVGFSKLRESQMPAFVATFLGLVGDVVGEMTNNIQLVNTWGDGIYMVFRRAEHAGVFALALRDRVIGKDWAAVGLPGALSLRIGLHAGPVYSCVDPVTQRPTVVGSNVVRTARIEPIAPAGGIYTSHEFAGLAAFENVDQFRCEYVGKIPVAKGYGEYPTFCLFPNASQVLPMPFQATPKEAA